MNSPTDSQHSKAASAAKSSFKLPKKEDMANPLRLAAEARELTDEEQRYLFRELAKQLLDPNAEEIFTLCDNEENVLGYFEPVLRHFRERAKEFQPVAVESVEEFMEGAIPFDEFIERVMKKHESKNK